MASLISASSVRVYYQTPPFPSIRRSRPTEGGRRPNSPELNENRFPRFLRASFDIRDVKNFSFLNFMGENALESFRKDGFSLGRRVTETIWAERCRRFKE